jgi:hypothetical protein
MAEPRPGAAGNLQRRWPRRLPRGRRGPAAAAFHVTCAALLVLVVLASGLEIHPASESHDPLASFAHSEGEAYFPGASHPIQPHHAEAARMAQRPVCAICLNRLQNVGARPAPATRVTSSLAGGSLPIASALSPLQRSLRPDGARAPPAA